MRFEVDYIVEDFTTDAVDVARRVLDARGVDEFAVYYWGRAGIPTVRYSSAVDPVSEWPDAPRAVRDSILFGVKTRELPSGPPGLDLP